jgi:arylsulfatase A-like enzyme
MAATETTMRPNIVFIMADDLGPTSIASPNAARASAAT